MGTVRYPNAAGGVEIVIRLLQQVGAFRAGPRGRATTSVDDDVTGSQCGH